jgi:hypothetical protein
MKKPNIKAEFNKLNRERNSITAKMSVYLNTGKGDINALVEKSVEAGKMMNEFLKRNPDFIKPEN